MYRRLITADLRREMRSPKWVLLLVLACLPVAQGVAEAQQGVFRDRLDVLSVIETSPLVLVLPLVVTPFTADRLVAELARRFASVMAFRASPNTYVIAKLVTAGIMGFWTGVLLTVPPLLTAFVIWPVWGDPFIDPGVYRMTALEAAADARGRFSFTELLAGGPVGYAMFFAIWSGIACAAISVAGVAFLLVIENRFLALALPFLIYLGESILVSVLGHEQLAVMFALFPFGLNQATIASAAVGLMVVSSAALFAIVVVRHVDRLQVLQ